jgi:predicted dienelactone hydrolase
MGAIILILAAVIEIAFAAYCITTKSTQPKIRSWVRVGAGVTFVLLTLVSVIQWSFRWYLLAVVLGIWALTAGLSLSRNRVVANQGYSPLRIILKAIALWLVVVIAAVPLLAFPQVTLPAPTGTHQVETVTYTYTDTSRVETFTNTGEHRKVTVAFWYPADATGKYPLVVFDHGAFGMKGSNTSTFQELASHGYVVASLDHPYHSLYTKETDGHGTMVNQAFLQEVQDLNAGVYDDSTANELEHKWLKLRTDDIDFVLDTILQNAGGSREKVYQLVDTGKIGLFGHSLGGAASVQLGRERKDIAAVVNLDGDLLGEYLGVKDGKPVINHAIYPVPILSLWTDDMKRGFDNLKDATIELPQKQILATAPKAYEAYFAGTNHMSLTDLPLISPAAVKLISGSFSKMGDGAAADKVYVITTMNRLVLAFFDANLKGEGTFRSAGNY